jgi:lipoate-protein ligase A
MLFVDNLQQTDPRLNLALEEYLLRQAVDEPLLLFYVNEPAVIIGRNQDTAAEIDADFAHAEGIHVVRRLSGGGAVFHDAGNLNFSFITNGRSDLHNFTLFTEPVVQVLRQLGVPAELREQSSIFAHDKKISGNAQYASGGRMFSHGTLLFDSNLEILLRVLNPQKAEITSRAVQSIRSVVGNIREMLAQDMTLAAFRSFLLMGIFDAAEIPMLPLTEGDWAAVRQLADERYGRSAWNWGPGE